MSLRDVKRNLYHIAIEQCEIVSNLTKTNISRSQSEHITKPLKITCLRSLRGFILFIKVFLRTILYLIGNTQFPIRQKKRPIRAFFVDRYKYIIFSTWYRRCRQPRQFRHYLCYRHNRVHKKEDYTFFLRRVKAVHLKKYTDCKFL